MLKFNKILFMTLLLISQAVIAKTENPNISMTKYFSDTYVVPDSVNAKEEVRQRVIEDLKIDHTHCDAKPPQLVDLIFTGSVYGPRYGQRTFYVDIYYNCPEIK